MGLFSRKTIINVSSVIYPLGDEPDQIPDVVKASIVTASVRKTSVSKAITSAIIDGTGRKISQGYNYAVNSYYAGMPNGFPNTKLNKNDPVLELLSKEYLEHIFPGQVVVVASTSVVYTNDYDTVVRDQIFNEFSYDFYLDATFATTGSVQTGASLVLTGPVVDTAHPDEVGYTLLFTNPDTSTVSIDRWYDADLFEFVTIIAQRVVIEYTLDGGPHETISYIFGGSDSRINIFLRDLQHPVSGTMPAMVLKKNNVYLDDNAFTGSDWKTSTAYKTTKAYGFRMGINVDDMLANVRTNPNEDDIDYAFIQPGTLINATSKDVVKYHFNYFNRLRLIYPDNKPAFDAWVAAYGYPAHTTVKKNQAENMPAQSIRLADPETPESSVDMEISWRYISIQTITGVVDEYEVECGSQETAFSHYGSGHGPSIPVEYETTKLYLRKQINDTQYEELCICGLWHENYVYKGHSVQSAVWDAFNDPDGDFGTGFLIPLDYTIFVTLSPRERLQLGQEAFHIIFNCYVEKKLHWYQTGFFKVILAIVAVVIAYLSWGAASAWVASLYGTLAATLSPLAAAIATASIVVTTFVGISLVAKEAGQWAAEHWGPLWGALIQIGASILLTWGVAALPGVPNMSPTTLIGQVSQASSYIISGMSAYTQYQYISLNEKTQEWQDFIDRKDDPLESITDKINAMFPDLTVAQQAILPHPETLDEFIGRTLTMTDGLTGRLLMPITNLAELTLTPRLI